MGRPSNYPDIVDECKTISIGDLKRMGYLGRDIQKKGSISWTNSLGEPIGSISITSDTRGAVHCVFLSYTIKGMGQEKSFNDMFYLVKKPSNLGQGFRYYFQCGDKLCFKLYAPRSQGEFGHRTDFKMIYDSQRESKNNRPLARSCSHYRRWKKVEGIKYRLFYKGKPTRTFKRTSRLANKANVAFDRSKKTTPHKERPARWYNIVKQF